MIIRNGVYEALEEFGQYLYTTGLPGTGAGTRVSTPETFESPAPSLIEVEVHPSNSGMFIDR